MHRYERLGPGNQEVSRVLKEAYPVPQDQHMFITAERASQDTRNYVSRESVISPGYKLIAAITLLRTSNQFLLEKTEEKKEASEKKKEDENQKKEEEEERPDNFNSPTQILFTAVTLVLVALYWSYFSATNPPPPEEEAVVLEFLAPQNMA